MRTILCRLNILHPWFYKFGGWRWCKHCGKTQVIKVFEGSEYWFTTGWRHHDQVVR